MAKILDGKKLSEEILLKLKREVTGLKEKYKKAPHLAVIMAGTYPPSIVYVNIKGKKAKEIGMDFTLFKMPETVEEQLVIKTINKLNRDKKINGIIVQLPLPKHLNERRILDHIAIEKDVDGLTTENIGALVSGYPYYIPCTPQGIMELVKLTKQKLEGKRAVIIGRSNIVGKPIAFLLLKEHCTVTLCHSRTRDLDREAASADILVVAIGRPHFVKGSWVKKAATVIDVGINRVEDKTSPKGYHLVGDVDFKAAVKKAAYITPVPGGVGPLTSIMLLKNTIESFKKNY
ncbi:MAG: bifunctional 5,10-methylenetetrahydrofolate dehydrogenase/5,10-methenyltetrahydrofolate cyclohydrolase [Spirochaetes bacterium]|nr:bifunctional 5,10-methylenetetrahydrofolate dehydrogenase/5,10-methenyltetrahydrofolate cyclohydrolase [Spirochaetota bacterium]